MSVQASNRGFTIFELMIAMAIAGIIAAFAIPGFQDLLARSRVNSTAEQVATSLASARTTAVTQRRTVVLEPNVGGWMMFLDCTPTTTGCTTSRRIESHEVKAPLVLSVTPAAATEISFLPTGLIRQTKPGTPTAIDLTVRICDSSVGNEVGKDVSISRVGKITSRRHADATTCNP